MGRSTLPPGDPRHGTENGYSNLSCRCTECRAAHTDTWRELRRYRWMRTRLNGGIAPGPRIHGSPSTYSNWGCQCEACIGAHVRTKRAQKSRSRTMGYGSESAVPDR